MSRTQKIIFAFSAVLALPAGAGSPVLLLYPIFVSAFLCGWRLPRIGAPAIRLLLSTLISTFLLEISAWFGNYITNTPDPALFHPQLIPDLIISIGFYSAWWLTWWLMLRRYHFTAQQVFITTGLYGVLIEQQGKIFLTGLETFPFGMLSWLFVAVVYGSTMALAFFLVRDSFTTPRDNWLKYPLAGGTLLILTIVGSLVWKLILQVLDSYF